MFDIFSQVNQLKTKMEQAREKLAQHEFVGESAGGKVKVVMDGKYNILSLEIDDKLLVPDHKVILQDLIVSAMQSAIRQSNDFSEQFMKQQFGDVIPGLDKFL